MPSEDEPRTWAPNFRWDVNLGHVIIVISMLVSAGFGYSNLVGEDVSIRREIAFERATREMVLNSVTDTLKRVEASSSDMRRELSAGIEQTKLQIQRVDNRITEIQTQRPVRP